ncbi:uncharacterized protein LOC143305430 [Osmia lignaria lignaria]|uniref:uncharacterized protein LOC143305430 n=1 Tax=Osmia lignaria lignaria TaxID=1437193 RepID=UPI00402BC10B
MGTAAKKPTAKRTTAGTTHPPATRKHRTAGGKASKEATKKPRLARSPNTSAVTLTVAPGAKTCSKAMLRARQEVDLAEIGITDLRPRRVATGGLVLEIAGTERVAKAVALASRLRTVFYRSEEVRVSCPVKMGEVRLIGLEESVAREEAAAAVVTAGGCTAADVKVGEIRTPPRGLERVWMSCPLTSANKLVGVGRLRVGWSSSRDRCFNCGDPNHRASGCTAPPRCPLYTDSGRPAGHRMGTFRSPRRRGGGRSPRQRRRARSSTRLIRPLGWWAPATREQLWRQRPFLQANINHSVGAQDIFMQTQAE